MHILCFYDKIIIKTINKKKKDDKNSTKKEEENKQGGIEVVLLNVI